MRIATDGASHPGIERRRFLELVAPIAALLIVAGGPARGQDAPATPGVAGASLIREVRFRPTNGPFEHAFRGRIRSRAFGLFDGRTVDNDIKDMLAFGRSPFVEVITERAPDGTGLVLIFRGGGKLNFGHGWPDEQNEYALRQIDEATGHRMGFRSDVAHARLAVKRIQARYEGMGQEIAEIKAIEGKDPEDIRLLIKIAEGPRVSTGLPVVLPPPLVMPSPAANLFKSDSFRLVKPLSVDVWPLERFLLLPSPTSPPENLRSPELLEAETRLNLARQANKAGDRRTALAEATLAIRAKPDWAEAYRFRGKVYGSKRLNRRAIADLSQAIRLEPKSRSFSQRGFFYCVERDFKRGLVDFEVALEVAPDDATRAYAYASRGAALIHRGDHQGAVADFDRAIALAPGSEYDHLGRGIALSKLGEFDRSVADFDRANAIKPGADNWYNRGESHFRQGIMRSPRPTSKRRSKTAQRMPIISTVAVSPCRPKAESTRRSPISAGPWPGTIVSPGRISPGAGRAWRSATSRARSLTSTGRLPSSKPASWISSTGSGRTRKILPDMIARSPSSRNSASGGLTSPGP